MATPRTPTPLTRDQVRTVDRYAIERAGFPGIVLMENAGRGAADVVLDRLGDDRPKRVAVLCGRGNNGGDGFVIARHLHIAGVRVAVVLIGDPDRLTGDALGNLQMARACGLEIQLVRGKGDLAIVDGALDGAGLIVDALLGTGFEGNVRVPYKQVIERINVGGLPVIAVDVPSGLDCQTGAAGDPTVRAAATVTFVAPKTGMLTDQARPYVGELIVKHIGISTEVVRRALASS